MKKIPSWVHPEDRKQLPFYRAETEEEKQTRIIYEQSDEYKKWNDSWEAFCKCIGIDKDGYSYIRTQMEVKSYEGQLVCFMTDKDGNCWEAKGKMTDCGYIQIISDFKLITDRQ